MYWERTSLRSEGLVVHLGHNGQRCPVATLWKRPLNVFHTNGIHQVAVSFCECGRQEGGYYFGIQLFRSTWFPTTLPQPRSAFTFQVLDLFHQLTLQGKTTAWDFYNSIIHTTDNASLNPPVVCGFPLVTNQLS